MESIVVVDGMRFACFFACTCFCAAGFAVITIFYVGLALPLKFTAWKEGQILHPEYALPPNITDITCEERSSVLTAPNIWASTDVFYLAGNLTSLWSWGSKYSQDWAIGLHTNTTVGDHFIDMGIGFSVGVGFIAGSVPAVLVALILLVLLSVGLYVFNFLAYAVFTKFHVYHLDYYVLLCQDIPAIGVVAFGWFSLPVYSVYILYLMKSLKDTTWVPPEHSWGCGITEESSFVMEQIIDAILDIQVLLSMLGVAPWYLTVLQSMTVLQSFCIVPLLLSNSCDYRKALHLKMLEDVPQYAISIACFISVSMHQVSEYMIYSFCTNMISILILWKKYYQSQEANARSSLVMNLLEDQTCVRT